MSNFSAPSESLKGEMADWVTDNASALVEAVFDGDWANKLRELFANNGTGASDTPSAPSTPALPPEPALYSNVSFTNVSPSDRTRRTYDATRTRNGWNTSSGTSRLPKTGATWAQIVEFAENHNVVVNREGPLNV